jgi:high affinity sulfate transporter 1
MINDYPVNPAVSHRLRLFRSIGPTHGFGVLKDLLAGATLASMSIPQVLGYARIAGAPVVTGLYTLLLPLVAFAAFGSSRFLVVAADSATAAILAGGLRDQAPLTSSTYVALAGSVALMTGGCLLLARLLKLGFLADFLSQTVLVGFLTGVGFQVAIAVLGEMLGIAVHSETTRGQLSEVIGGLFTTHMPSLSLSVAVVVCILASRHFSPLFPGPLIVVAVAVVASSALDFAGHGIQVLGTVPSGLPVLAIPTASWKEAGKLFPVALACFVIIVAQSAATARAYAVRHSQQLDEDSDLLGLAAANVSAAFCGTFVVDGSPTQTAMVERSGGNSQLVHLSTALVVASVLLFLTGPLRFLPQCVLGAVVFTIAIGLIDLRSLRDIRRESPDEFWLAVITAATVVLVGVEQGILLAMTLSLLRIVRHSYHPHTAILIEDQTGNWRVTAVRPGVESEPGVVVYRFGAPLFYANANRFSQEIRSLVEQSPTTMSWLIVDAGPITRIDYTAARVVRQLQTDLAEHGVRLAVAHVGSDLQADLDRHHLTEAIGTAQIFDTLREALARVHRGH